MFFNKHLVLVGVLLGLAVPLTASPVNVVSITDDFAAITREIGGDHVKVSVLISGSRNLHHIDPRPSMVMKVKRADMLIRLGMDQDSWIDGLIHAAKNKSVFPGEVGYLDPSGPIHKLEVPHGSVDKSHGDVHIEGNPHYWLDPLNGIIIARQIRDKLTAIDPENAAVFASNFKAFKSEIEQKMTEWQIKMKPMKNTQIVTYHKVWSYFFEAFHLNPVGELEVLPGIPPTTRHLAKLKTTLQKNKADKLVLMTTYYPETVGKRFAKDINAKFVAVPVNSTSYTGLFDVIIGQLQP